MIKDVTGKMIGLTFFLLLYVQLGEAQVVVIANKSVPPEAITKSQVLDFYTGDIKKWSDDQTVVVLDLKPKGDVRHKFYDFLGKSPARMKSIWLKQMLSGEGDPPQALKSEDEMVRKVASTPGAIGFVHKDKVTGNVKQLLVIEDKKSGS